jgi:hypothetical protein
MGDGTIDAGDVTIGLRGLMARFLWDGRSGLARTNVALASSSNFSLLVREPARDRRPHCVVCRFSI